MSPIVNVGGGGGGLTNLFTSVLGSPAASIDTGAGGIAGGFNILVVYFALQGSSAAGVVNTAWTFNNDTGGNYDFQTVLSNSTTVASAASAAGTSVTVPVHDTGGTSGYAGVGSLVIPNYAGTTFNKAGTFTVGQIDATATNNRNGVITFGYRSTSAITRLKVAVASGNFTTGSGIWVYGI